jgi:hypothetical protein
MPLARKVARTLTLSLSLGYVLFYFSEVLFWARVQPEDTILGWAQAWGIYSFAAYLTLVGLWRFGSDAWWKVFLVGALFGWFIEGVIVQTTYEAIPLSLSFTPLAQHALISVGVGWYVLGGIRATPSPRTVLRTSVIIGASYGLWSLNWWVADGARASVVSFAAYSTIATALLAVAYLVASRSLKPGFRPGRRAPWVAVAIVGVLFAFVVAGFPLAALVLPPLAALTVVALVRGTRGRFVPTQVTARVPGDVRTVLPLLAIPAIAVAIYALAAALGVSFKSNIVLYLVLTPAGFWAYGASVIRGWRGGSRRA